MEIIIKAKNAKLAPEAHEIITKKINKLTRYCDCIIKADVEIGVTTFHHQKGDIYRAEVNLAVPKKIIRAEAETDTIDKSISEMLKRLKAELIKYKQKHGFHGASQK
ncbi:MAG: ribosome-associated translation inhibitor RaiA [Patescibacteria group bacterium]